MTSHRYDKDLASAIVSTDEIVAAISTL